MSEFKVGDRVRYTGTSGCVRSGMEGKVITTFPGYIGVEWDENVGGHSGHDNIGKYGHCWNVQPYQIEHVTQARATPKVDTESPVEWPSESDIETYTKTAKCLAEHDHCLRVPCDECPIRRTPYCGPNSIGELRKGAERWLREHPTPPKIESMVSVEISRPERLKVGDIVEVIGKTEGFGLPVGTIAKIVIDDITDRPFRIQDSKGDYGWVLTSEVKKTTKSFVEHPSELFKKGDIVRVADAYFSLVAGDICKILSVDKSDDDETFRLCRIYDGLEQWIEGGVSKIEKYDGPLPYTDSQSESSSKSHAGETVWGDTPYLSSFDSMVPRAYLAGHTHVQPAVVHGITTVEPESEKPQTSQATALDKLEIEDD